MVTGVLEQTVSLFNKSVNTNRWQLVHDLRAVNAFVEAEVSHVSHSDSGI